MKQITVNEYGEPREVIEYVENAEVPSVSPNEIRFESKAFGLNFASVQARRGTYPESRDTPYVPGIEAAGVVDKVGEDVDVDLSEGDRVAYTFAHGGAMQQYSTVSVEDTNLTDGPSEFSVIEFSVIEIPDEMTFNEGAALLVRYYTARACLYYRGDVTHPLVNSVLIHAVAGGVGSTAVELANQHDVEIYGTASTRDKLQAAKERGLDYGINYEESDISDEIDGGVDLVLDGVGGDAFKQSIDILNTGGTIVSYGVASERPGFLDTKTAIYEDYTLEGFHLYAAARGIQRDAVNAIQTFSEDYLNGVISPNIDKVFHLSQLAEAHEYMANRKNVGKVILTIE